MGQMLSWVATWRVLLLFWEPPIQRLPQPRYLHLQLVPVQRTLETELQEVQAHKCTRMEVDGKPS